VKLTVESIGDESRAPGAISACFAPEGVLREHTWASGGWEHVTLWAACRDDGLLPAPGRETVPQRLVDAMRRGREAVGRESPVSRNAGQGSAGPRPHRAGSSAELRGHRTSLRAVTNRDLPFLHSLAAGPASSQLGRGSLMLPSEALFERWWRGANTVDLIVEDYGGQPIGEVYLYGVEPLDRRANLGCAFLRETWGTFPVVDALHTAVRYAFGPLGLRKLGVEIPEWNLDRLRSGIGRLLTVEAVRRDHLYRDGRYGYQVVAALTPDVVVNRDRRRARGRGAQAVTGAEPATLGATFGQPTSRS
jgi:RimJ/RimL family protein N-acetyltransferase